MFSGDDGDSLSLEDVAMHPASEKNIDRALDEALMATFPASDPVALSAHPDHNRIQVRPSRGAAKVKSGKRR